MDEKRTIRLGSKKRSRTERRIRTKEIAGRRKGFGIRMRRRAI